MSFHKDYPKPEDLMGEAEIFKQLTKALIERCLTAELEHAWINQSITVRCQCGA
jgi:hypothetical protein